MHLLRCTPVELGAVGLTQRFAVFSPMAAKLSRCNDTLVQSLVLYLAEKYFPLILGN